MKVVLVNGSPNEKGCTYTALKEMADEFGRQDRKSTRLNSSHPK